MSRIYFHSPSAPAAEVSGMERGMAGLYCTDALLQALGLSGRFTDPKWARTVAGLLTNRPDYLVPERYPEMRGFVESLVCHLSVWQENERFDLGERGRVDVFTVALNTLIATGSGPMILAARVHGQSEVHGYVEGDNRAWLAGIIVEGRESGIFRAGMGWESVVDLLHSRDDEPVVMSYSVTDQFPNRHVSTWVPPSFEAEEGEEDLEEAAAAAAGEAWHDLTPAEQWRTSLEALRDRSRYGLELKPDEWKWGDYYFGSAPVTGFHVAAAGLMDREKP